MNYGKVISKDRTLLDYAKQREPSNRRGSDQGNKNRSAEKRTRQMNEDENVLKRIREEQDRAHKAFQERYNRFSEKRICVNQGNRYGGGHKWEHLYKWPFAVLCQEGFYSERVETHLEELALNYTLSYCMNFRKLADSVAGKYPRESDAAERSVTTMEFTHKLPLGSFALYRVVKRFRTTVNIESVFPEIYLPERPDLRLLKMNEFSFLKKSSGRNMALAIQKLRLGDLIYVTGLLANPKRRFPPDQFRFSDANKYSTEPAYIVTEYYLLLRNVINSVVIRGVSEENGVVTCLAEKSKVVYKSHIKEFPGRSWRNRVFIASVFFPLSYEKTFLKSICNESTLIEEMNVITKFPEAPSSIVEIRDMTSQELSKYREEKKSTQKRSATQESRDSDQREPSTLV